MHRCTIIKMKCQKNSAIHRFIYYDLKDGIQALYLTLTASVQHLLHWSKTFHRVGWSGIVRNIIPLPYLINLL